MTTTIMNSSSILCHPPSTCTPAAPLPLSPPYKHKHQPLHNTSLSFLPQPLKSGFHCLTHGCSWLQDTSTSYDITTHNGCRPLPAVFRTASAVVSSVDNLYDFICSGPLIEKMGLTPKMVEDNIDKWIECGLHLSKLFRLNELNLTIPQKARLFHYYIPVFFWCEDQVLQHKSSFKDGEEIPPLVVYKNILSRCVFIIVCFAIFFGYEKCFTTSEENSFPFSSHRTTYITEREVEIGFSAPQGCGKTTLVFALDYLFKNAGRKSATVSIDDFYLTAEDQAKLREQYPGNTLLELRGNAGSHDLPFSVETLTGLTKMTKEGMKMKLPRYNKSAYGGKGDRADPSTWPEVKGPLTVILFEGWMLGFKPVPMEVVKAVDPQLEVVNKKLEAYYEAWDKFINAWIVIKIKDPSCVFQWRLQAEIAMREEGKPGMSDEEIRDFVSRYLPAYNAYLPTLYSEGPSGSDPEHLLVVDIDEERNPILAN